MLVNNLQTIHQHHSACSSKLLCLFCQLVLKLCYVTPYSMLWMGKRSHRPIICYSSLQSMLGRCLPCYEGEGFIALLWLMGKRKNDPDAKNRSKAMHFSLAVKSHAWRRKSTLSVMLSPGNSWREGTTRALPSHRLGRLRYWVTEWRQVLCWQAKVKARVKMRASRASSSHTLWGSNCSSPGGCISVWYSTFQSCISLYLLCLRCQ